MAEKIAWLERRREGFQILSGEDEILYRPNRALA